MDQAGLLGAGDHLDVDARLAAGPVEEDTGVGRLAHGAGGDGAQRGAVAVDDAAHPAQAGDAPLDGRRRQLLHVAAPVAEADDLLLAGQRLEAVVADGAGDHEVEAVGADVEGGEHDAGLRLDVTASVIESGDACVEAIEHTLAEAGDLLEPAAEDVVGRAESSPTTSAVWMASSRSPGSMNARRAPSLRVVVAGTSVAAHAPVRQSPARNRASPSSGLPRASCAASLQAPPSDVADDEVAEAVVQVAGRAARRRTPAASPGSTRRRC